MDIGESWMKRTRILNKKWTRCRKTCFGEWKTVKTCYDLVWTTSMCRIQSEKPRIKWRNRWSTWKTSRSRGWRRASRSWGSASFRRTTSWGRSSRTRRSSCRHTTPRSSTSWASSACSRCSRRSRASSTRRSATTKACRTTSRTSRTRSASSASASSSLSSTCAASSSSSTPIRASYPSRGAVLREHPRAARVPSPKSVLRSCPESQPIQLEGAGSKDRRL